MKKILGDVKGDIEWCYSPIVQSGRYDLRVSAQSNDEDVEASVVVVSMGVCFSPLSVFSRLMR